jgi:hypothetical protein
MTSAVWALNMCIPFLKIPSIQFYLGICSPEVGEIEFNSLEIFSIKSQIWVSGSFGDRMFIFTMSRPMVNEILSMNKSPEIVQARVMRTSALADRQHITSQLIVLREAQNLKIL